MSERGLVLVGMPASGKTTLGRLVADRLGRPLLDTDLLFERRHGVGVPEFLRRRGEPAFREAERQAVIEACAVDGAIISVGGGALDDPLNRWDLWAHGTVAWLRAEPRTLLQRLVADPTPRPTFEPYRLEHLEQVMAQRAPLYRAADLMLDAAAPVEAIAEELLRCLERRKPPGRRLFDVELPRAHPIGPERARVVYGHGLDRDAVESALGPLAERQPALVVDRRAAAALPDLMASLPAAHCLPLDGGERTKRIRHLERILEWLAAERVERGVALLALGGGTIGDLAGTAAALWGRGTPLVQLPTTWLAQADSAIGGKVGIDLRSAKNAAGAFWPPAAVVADTAAIGTLPLARRRDGMAESVKAALIGDAGLWRLIEKRGAAALRADLPARYAIVERAARLKMAVCADDPFERGARRNLNLGHTLGHALEVESGYRLSHGAAVTMGMRAVAAIGAGRGADPQLGERLDTLLDRLGFRLRTAFDPNAVRDAMLADKKRLAGRQRWILPLGIGKVVEVDDVTDAELERAMQTIAADR